jgi:short-subunit dehydrogenase
VADLASPSAPPEIFAQLSGTPVDLLINNAGFGVRGAFGATDWARESALMQVNMVALAHLTKLFLPEMVRRGSGRILNVASTAAFVPGPFMALYYASKAFVLSFSEALSNEVQGTGVTVTVLCPGPTRTEFAKAAGIADSELFHGPVMGAAEVARIGYDAAMAGKSSVIAGALNRWMIRGVRLVPRSFAAAQAGKLNRAK